MGQYRQIRTLKKFIDWVNDVQKDFPKIARDFEDAFEDELDAKDVEITALMNMIDDFYTTTDNAKNYSIDLIQKMESHQVGDNF